MLTIGVSMIVIIVRGLLLVAIINDLEVIESYCVQSINIVYVRI